MKHRLNLNDETSSDNISNVSYGIKQGNVTRDMKVIKGLF